MKGESRTSGRNSFCEWASESFGHYNNGGIICNTCNFSRSLNLREKYNHYEMNNKIDREGNCPNCKSNNWYWLPPIARVPRSNSSKEIWETFWKDLKNRRFNHPEKGCR